MLHMCNSCFTVGPEVEIAKNELYFWGGNGLENKSADYSSHNSEKIMSLADPELISWVFELAETLIRK